MPSRILIADDTAVVREYLEMIFTRHSFQVIMAANGEDALRLAREHRPDLMLVDVMMPGIDGVDVTRLVRAEPAISGTPVILFSAVAGEEVRQRALLAGADEFLDKTIHHAALVDRVRDWLATRSGPGGVGRPVFVRVGLDLLSILQTDWVWLLKAEEEGLSSLAVVCVRGEQEAARFLERAASSKALTSPAGPLAGVLKTRVPRHGWMTAELARDPQAAPLADAAGGFGTRAIGVLPLRGPGGVEGVLIFASPATLQPADDALRLEQAAMGYASTALAVEGDADQGQVSAA